MNLYDMISRKAAEFDPGLVLAEPRTGPQGKERAVLISPGASIRLERAHEIQCLECFPQELGWTASPDQPGIARMEVAIILETSQEKVVLENLEMPDSVPPKNVLLRWPVAAASTGFDFMITNKGDIAVKLSVGMAWSARANLLSSLRGKGLEVGPGFNPCILPNTGLDIRYIENITAEDWRGKYGKTADIGEMEKLWDKYIICSAERLELIEDNSLDFIFSNHVFEHLVNPLGVLNNWHQKLKKDGVVVGVVPDARYTFDLRQPISEDKEILEEFANNSFALERRHYLRWCLYTTPQANPDKLMKRNYSVHAKYYTPESFKRMLNYSMQYAGWCEIFVQKALNGKDFGFSIKKS